MNDHEVTPRAAGRRSARSPSTPPGSSAERRATEPGAPPPARFRATGNRPAWPRERRSDLARLPADIRWQTSTHSNTQGGTCIEVGHHGGTVYIRDSRNRSGTVIVITASGWTNFLTSIREFR
ncbi:DUF397 domain-containing protein [Actinomadura sp. KC345]|nr:DUF397 domain-containing protein [Actinomadura sp. KC345]